MFPGILKTTVLSAFCGLIHLVIWTYAEQSSTLYELETLTCDITYGNVIGTTQAKSAIHCSYYCESTSGCRSSVLSLSTGTCYLNNNIVTLENMVQGECGKDLKYIVKQAVSRQCESGAECIEKELGLCEDSDDNCAFCNKGECTCKWFSYYSVNDNLCRRNCLSYEDTFEYYKDYHYVWTDKATRNSVSFEECREACLSETNFTCSWFSYREVSSLCTYTDGYQNGRAYHGYNSVIYRRFCADQ